MGRDSGPRDDGKTWRERCFDDDLAHVRACRAESVEDELREDTQFHAARHGEIWKFLRQLGVDLKDLRRRFEFEAWRRKPKKPEKPSESMHPDRKRVSL